MQIPFIAYFISFVTVFLVFIFSISALSIELIKRKRNKKIMTETEKLNAENLVAWNEERLKHREKAKTEVEDHRKAKIVEIEYHEEETPHVKHPYNQNLIKFK